MKREQILSQLAEKFNSNFANNGYKSEFKPDGYLTQCNFGGLFLILGNTGESCLVWSDWAGDAISEELTECEIDYKKNEDSEDIEAYFTFQGTDYFLSEFMRYK